MWWGRYRSYYGGKSDGIGIGIFYIMLICMPFIGWVFNVLDWMLDHIIIIIVVILFIWISRWCIKEDMREQKEKENNL